jgi:hypothetical protein
VGGAQREVRGTSGDMRHGTSGTRRGGAVRGAGASASVLSGKDGRREGIVIETIMKEACLCYKLRQWRSSQSMNECLLIGLVISM